MVLTMQIRSFVGLAATGIIANSSVLATPDVVAVNGRKKWEEKPGQPDPNPTRPGFASDFG